MGTVKFFLKKLLILDFQSELLEKWCSKSFGLKRRQFSLRASALVFS